MSAERKALYDRQLTEAMRQYADDDARYFGVVLPQREHWRLAAL
jgi:hypothetical protein